MSEFLFKNRGKVPVPLLILTFAWLLLRPEKELNPAVFLTGVAITLIGEAIRIWSVGYAGASTRGTKASARQLVTGGPYAYVRNPIYIGNFLVSLGVVLTTQSWFFTFLFVIYFAVVYFMIVLHEESFLSKQFGETYKSYTQNVCRFLPKRIPYANQQGTFVWRELRKEYWTILGFTVGFILVGYAGRISLWLRGL